LSQVFRQSPEDYFEAETHIFVHANYDPERPMNRISGTKLRWEHLDVNRLRPHCSGKTVVVGHTPQVSGEVLDLGYLIGIDTDCFQGGWLSALDVGTGGVVQANQRGEVREAGGIPQWSKRSPCIPSPIQYFLQCRMTAGAHFDQGLIVSHVGHS